MMIVMKSKPANSPAVSRKEATHERIVEVVSRAIRRSGYDGTGVVALVARIAAEAPEGQALQALMDAYLSPQHIAAIENGCPVCALGSDMPRQAPEVRRAATLRIK